MNQLYCCYSLNLRNFLYENVSVILKEREIKELMNQKQYRNIYITN